jgi:RNA polymerase sigma-70 factor (ECF subfamily)
MENGETDRMPEAPLQGSIDALPSLILLDRLKHGDAKARDELVRRYWPRLQRWAHGRLPAGARDLHDTTDLVQETMVAALRRLDEFEPEHDGALQAYLRTAILNRIRKVAKRAGARGEKIEMDSGVLDRSPSPLEQAIGRETLERYERALRRLRPDDREAIHLKLELALPYSEIAREMGKPTLTAARKAVSRALARLAREMQHA